MQFTVEYTDGESETININPNLGRTTGMKIQRQIKGQYTAEPGKQRSGKLVIDNWGDYQADVIDVLHEEVLKPKISRDLDDGVEVTMQTMTELTKQYEDDLKGLGTKK